MWRGYLPRPADLRVENCISHGASEIDFIITLSPRWHGLTSPQAKGHLPLRTLSLPHLPQGTLCCFSNNPSSVLQRGHTQAVPRAWTSVPAPSPTPAPSISGWLQVRKKQLLFSRRLVSPAVFHILECIGITLNGGLKSRSWPCLAYP